MRAGPYRLGLITLLLAAGGGLAARLLPHTSPRVSDFPARAHPLARPSLPAIGLPGAAAAHAPPPARTAPSPAAGPGPLNLVLSVLAEPPGRRLTAATAVLLTLADRPEQAVHVARELCARDPLFVREHGSTLVTVLVENQRFGPALHFAENGGPERVGWVTQTFAHWARIDPAAAARAALAQPEGDGFAIVSAAWSERDPVGFVDFARRLPGTELRAAVLADAWRRWRERDPAHAEVWAEHFDPERPPSSGRPSKEGE